MNIINDYSIIPLGHACELSVILNEKQIRNTSLPFDWLRTYSFEKIINLIIQKDNNFLEDVSYNELPYKVYVNNKYKVLHVHDDFNNLNELKNKFNKRIQRLLQLIYSNENKIILRYYPIDKHSYDTIFFSKLNTSNQPNDYIDRDSYKKIVENDCQVFLESELHKNNIIFVQILLYDVDIAINSNIYQFKYNCKNNEKYSRDNTGKFQKECINNCVNEMYKMKFIDFTPFHV